VGQQESGDMDLGDHRKGGTFISVKQETKAGLDRKEAG
jgi:hypothetical protein